MAMLNHITQEDFRTFLLEQSPADIFGWVTHSKSIIYDITKNQLSLFDTAALPHGEDNPQRVLPGAELMADVAKNNPKLVDQLADAVLLSIQLDERLVESRLNRVREKFSLAPLHEPSVSQAVYEGCVLDQNRDQTILQEKKTGRHILLEHKNLENKPETSGRVRVSYDFSNQSWKVASLKTRQDERSNLGV